MRLNSTLLKPSGPSESLAALRLTAKHWLPISGLGINTRRCELQQTGSPSVSTCAILILPSENDLAWPMTRLARSRLLQGPTSAASAPEPEPEPIAATRNTQEYFICE